MPSNDSKLFQPMKLGPCTLSSRIVMGPLSSNLADDKNVLSPQAVEYYGSRACVPGTLIIGEATFVSAAAGGTPESRAGIWTPAQISSWKSVVDEVHRAGSYIFLQLWALGRSADPACKARDASGDVVSSSAIPESDRSSVVPRPLTSDEITTYIADHATAAKNAIDLAGFDGIELHGGNGSLIDQFTQDTVNQRTDRWGGNIPNRSRFSLEIAKAVCDAIGPERVGFRISPFSTYNSMGMVDPIPQFLHLIDGLKGLGIAYLHLVESRIAGRVDVEAGEPLTPFVEAWRGCGRPMVLAGGYDPESARRAVDVEYAGGEEEDVAIAFGRAFVTNPDLVRRLRDGVELRKG